MVKLTTACNRDEPLGIYKALRYDMAKKLQTVESGRDYAAIAKSFVAVQERIDELGGRSARDEGRRSSALAQAQARHLKVING